MATYKKLPADEYGSIDWLRREIGGFLGAGFNPDAWPVELVEKIDSIIQSGLMQFYYPPPLPVGDKGETMLHRWSFLTPVEDITLTMGESTYALPEDFAGISEEGFTVG